MTRSPIWITVFRMRMEGAGYRVTAARSLDGEREVFLTRRRFRSWSLREKRDGKMWHVSTSESEAEAVAWLSGDKHNWATDVKCPICGVPEGMVCADAFGAKCPPHMARVRLSRSLAEL